mgnify:CR=1 FL=1
MVDSGSMVNLLPSKLVREAGLVRHQCDIGLRALGGFECEVDGVVEAEEVEVAKVVRPLSFLSVKSTEVILGRPFMFGFRAKMSFDPETREEVLSVADQDGQRFETTVCDPGRGRWVQKVTAKGEEVMEDGESEVDEPPPEDFS